MGFAWMPDSRAGGRGDSYRDDQGSGRRYLAGSGARASQRSPAGRHALSHGQRPLLASFGVARALGHVERAERIYRIDRADLASSRENRDYHGTGRGAHAARLADVPRRVSGWPGPERWRRWA